MSTFSLDLEKQVVEKWAGIRISGRVTQIIGLIIESVGPVVQLGELCYIFNQKQQAIPCEVVGFKENRVLLLPLGEMLHIAPGSEVYPTYNLPTVAVSESLCGRVIDALGQPLDDKGPIKAACYYPLHAAPPPPLTRKLISTIFATGVKAIDATCTIGTGQRIGIFSASGVGKSTLLSMIAKMSTADIIVIALIGERGREIRAFIERELGVEGLKKSVIIAVTSDQPAILRAKGAQTATAITEYFRDLGKNVLFLMDSVTRYAMAWREIGLAIGEPPTTKGYTPSVFANLARLIERTGNSAVGSITAIYTVLVEADDINDPIADTVRAILDGHIELSRKLASANHYPAIDVLASLSRLMQVVTTAEHYHDASRLRDILQTYKEAEDLINIGAYVIGSNSRIDEALSLIEPIRLFLTQAPSQRMPIEKTLYLLRNLVGNADLPPLSYIHS